MITKEYTNTNNGGKERFSTDGKSFYVNSYIPTVGWMGERKISRVDAERAMAYTNAPSSVVTAIIG